jgi:hypothetical protein
LPIVLQAEAAVRSCGVSPKAGSRRQGDLSVRLARAFRTRIEGREDPDVWAQLARDWAELGDPYEAAKARWREAEGLLDKARGRSTRVVAREPLTLTYLVTNEYDGTDELGFAWDDTEAAVPWPDRSPILSERDANAPSLAALVARLRAQA